MPLARVATGIQGLDEMTAGGFVERSANLVEGAPGTGKTTLGLQFLMEGIENRAEAGLYLSFEEFPAQLYADAAKLGWDLRKYESEGRLRIVFTDPLSLLADLETVDGPMERLIEEFCIKRVVIDSLSHFEFISDDVFQLRDMEFRLVSALKREGCTSVLLRENANLMGETNSLSRSPFVVDSFLILRYVELESAVSKAILVLKMRGSAHHTDIRRYTIQKGGIKIESKFLGQEGILGGSPRKSRAQAFVEAFGGRRK
ncbi:MAG: AAA family ATPase [Fibrobacteria bacterium]|nr:AAA family ATPase [Fibrobacteria bacterium]